METSTNLFNKANKKWFYIWGCLILSAIIFFSPVTLFWFFKDKIWAHRVNSLEKLAEAQTSFVGVELDLVFNAQEKYYDVNHPPASSIHLSLKQYFASLKQPAKLNYWLDFKNLNAANQETAFNQLEKLAATFQLSKKQLIVESRQPEYLTLFQQAGYKTTYYLPPNLHKMPLDKLTSTIQEIKMNLGDNEEIYISSFYKDYYLMRKYFPNRKKLLWNLFYDIYGYRGDLYYMLMDEKVEVMLITFWAKEGNR